MRAEMTMNIGEKAEMVGIIPRKNYRIIEQVAKEFMSKVDHENYNEAFFMARGNPQLTFALPILYVREAYWGISRTLGHERGSEFLESCERALNNGEEDISLRQLILKREDSWLSGVHEGRKE